MNFRSVFHLISHLVMVISAAVALSAVVGWAYGDDMGTVLPMLGAAVLSGLLGLGGFCFTRGAVELTRKDGFAVVTLGWLVVAHVGALPYWMTGAIPHPVDAFFETISGFTTTGATILTDIEALPRGILFWRSLTQWLGGMGVLLLCVAILPFLGVGGMQLYRAEMPGPSKDRLTPRIANTAKLLYGVYVILTLLQFVALRLAGMSGYDAINHAFTTLSSGGFSTYNASIAHFASPWIHAIITLFMAMAGVNFALHFRWMRGDFRALRRSMELRVYAGVLGVAVLWIVVNLWATRSQSPARLLLDAAFQVVSIVTTTGFATVDFDLWPLGARTLMFVLLFTGGCAGSTAGGIKMMRLIVVCKECFRQIRLFMQPQAVLKVRLDQQSVQPAIVAGIMAFFVAYMLIFATFTLLMTVYTGDLQTAASAVIACLGNVGPGFGQVGPTENFAFFSEPAKILLSFCMLLGRLELFTVLVMFSPGFWKR